jgi:hypothetical protein
MNHSATADQILWQRLSVFAGSFAQEAAEAVCAGESIERSAVPDLLARLTDQSLVVVEKQGKDTRYHLIASPSLLLMLIASARSISSSPAHPKRISSRHAITSHLGARSP